MALHLELSRDFTRAIRMYRVGADAQVPSMRAEGAETALFYRVECLRALVRLETGKERLAAIESLLLALSAPGVVDLPVLASRAGPSALAELEESREIALLETGRSAYMEKDLSSWLDSRALNAEIVRAFDRLPDDILDEIARKSYAWRSKVYAREYQAAWLGAEAALAEFGWPVGRPALSDLGRAALYGAPDAGAVSLGFEREASLRSGDDRYVLLFYAARLAWRSGNPVANEVSGERGARLMALARDGAVGSADRDAAAWYLIDNASRQGTAALIAEVARESPLWSDPAWFADILDDAISPLVAARAWPQLGSLRDSLGGRGPAEIEARLAYLAARSGRLSEGDARLELERIRNTARYPTYYRLLAADSLGLPFVSPDEFASTLAGERQGTRASGLADVLRALIEWKLEDRVYPLVRELGFAPLPPDSLEIAAKLGTAGLYSDALRLAVTALSVSDYKAGLADLFAVYPRPWAAEVAGAALDSGVSETLLYALIRSESFFDPGASSGAGAVGLTQLMEATAADVARKARRETYDLRDPATNISLGASYLGELLARLDGSALDALFAYNAGITRVREWRRARKGLDDDLFLESIPFAETREYGRKVVVASALYGYLYYRIPADRSVRFIIRNKGPGS